jgi:hypothetical protein
MKNWDVPHPGSGKSGELLVPLSLKGKGREQPQSQVRGCSKS